MIPVYGKIDPGPHGDCVRACVASILEMKSADVPHFYHDADPTSGRNRIREFLALLGYAPFWTTFNGSESIETLLETMGVVNENAYYILFASNGDGNHAVVCRGGEIVHDPSLWRKPIVGPLDIGDYVILVISKA